MTDEELLEKAAENEALNENIIEITHDYSQKTKELENEKTTLQTILSVLEDQSRKFERIIKDTDKELENTKHKLQMADEELV